MTQTDTSRPWNRCLTLAACYVGLAAASSVVYDAMGRPEVLGTLLGLATSPGAVLITYFVAYPLILPLDVPVETMAPETPTSLFNSLPLFTAGAVVNVLLVWGITAFARHFLREARRSAAQR
ncbi:hypothetical protein [Streptomyces sp. NPDC052042]|uniref:hypothetical protein n=1 Tax=Streptomyces sp. NPDC052042 TaxID=3365683 RepID=UPI0037D70FFE